MSKLPEVTTHNGLVGLVISGLLSLLGILVKLKKPTPGSQLTLRICCGALIFCLLLTGYLIIHNSENSNPCPAIQNQSSSGDQSPNVVNCGNGKVDINSSSDNRSAPDNLQTKEPAK